MCESDANFISISKEGIVFTFDDGKQVILNHQTAPTTLELVQNYIESRKNKQEFEGWLGGSYDTLGFFIDRKDAERGIFPSETLDELFDEYKENKVKITIEKLL